MGVEFYNSFRPRALDRGGEQTDNPEIPHCFMLVTGECLSVRHRNMLDKPVEPHAVYACVKMYVRDLLLSQPPLLICTTERLSRICGSSPRAVHAMVPLTEAQLKTFAMLADLCSGKYMLPRAAQALNSLMMDRKYVVYELTFMQQAPRSFLAMPEGNAQLPVLPSSCWRLMVRFKRS